MVLRVLKGQRKGRVFCEACCRTVTAGRRHKARRGDESFCPGFVPEDERRASSLYVAAVRALAGPAMRGDWRLLESASKATLRALGIDPRSVPPLDRYRRDARGKA